MFLRIPQPPFLDDANFIAPDGAWKSGTAYDHNNPSG
jgi:hypothetical protein